MFYIDYTSEPMENGVEGVWGKKTIYDVFVIILTSNDESLKSVIIGMYHRGMDLRMFKEILLIS